MSAQNAPRRALPARPSKEHLHKQAKRLAKSEALRLADAQRRLARDYGHRDWAALMRAIEATAAALARASEVAPGADEILAEELRTAAYALGRLLGKVDVEDILAKIFNDFCIGK